MEDSDDIDEAGRAFDERMDREEARRAFNQKYDEHLDELAQARFERRAYPTPDQDERAELHAEVIGRLDTINASLQELNASMQELIAILRPK